MSLHSGIPASAGHSKAVATHDTWHQQATSTAVATQGDISISWPQKSAVIYGVMRGCGIFIIMLPSLCLR